MSSVQNEEETYVEHSTEIKKTIANIWQELIYTDPLDPPYKNLESNGLKQLPLVTNKTISPTNALPSNLSQSDANGFSYISPTSNFYSLGGNSLQLVQAYRNYQSLFNFDTEILTIRPFFECNTIDEHAKLLEASINDNTQSKKWHTLHINNGNTFLLIHFLNKIRCFSVKLLGIASFAQERIFLDEQVRFSNKAAVYNELVVLRVVRGSLSIDCLQRAFRCVLNKHRVLRTSLIFNNDDSTLKQCVTDKHQTFTLATDQIFRNENELQDIIYQTAIASNLFDLSDGRVLHCQILRQQNIINKNYDARAIVDPDILIIAFHHIAFDLLTSQIFLSELCKAYNNHEIWSKNEESLQYIDYSVHERAMDMTTSREFWRLQLEGYNLKRPLLLPVDRHRSSNDQRFSSTSVAQILFDDNISTALLNYAFSHQVTLFQLTLATFYTFLFKLTHGQSDLCISCPNANRYRTELKNMIGMFVATVPYRIQLDSHWSFDELVKHVQEKCLPIFENSHYPLQHILADFNLNQSNISFLETIFDFITVSSNVNQLSFDGTSLEQVSLEQSSEVAKFDFILRFTYDSSLNDGKLSCRFVCSRDLFEETTVATIAQRFQYLFFQLFSLKSGAVRIDESITPINKLSLIFPEEAEEMQRVVFRRLPNIINEGMYV
jgi:hypothetical protein